MNVVAASRSSTHKKTFSIHKHTLDLYNDDILPIWLSQLHWSVYSHSDNDSDSEEIEMNTQRVLYWKKSECEEVFRFSSKHDYLTRLRVCCEDRIDVFGHMRECHIDNRYSIDVYGQHRLVFHGLAPIRIDFPSNTGRHMAQTYIVVTRGGRCLCRCNMLSTTTTSDNNPNHTTAYYEYNELYRLYANDEHNDSVSDYNKIVYGGVSDNDS